MFTKAAEEEQVWGGYFPGGPAVGGSGATYQEAKDDLIEGLQVYLDYALEHGTLIKQSLTLPELVDVKKEDPEAMSVELVEVQHNAQANGGA